MKTPALLLLLICLFCTCQRAGYKPQQNHISKIIFATGYCHGECPYQAIEIDSSLAYKYYGGEYARKKGYFQGIVDKGFWDSLNTDIEELGFWNLDTIYNNTVDDQSKEIIIYQGNKKKRIHGQDESFPKGLRQLFSKLYHSVDRVHITPFKDTINFESTLQEPLKLIGEPSFHPKRLYRCSLIQL
jgi:hypothetical protein